MFRETLFSELERRWSALIVLACLCASMPALYALRLRQVQTAWFAVTYEETTILTRVLTWILLVACAAWGFGAWAPERRGGWVYALALPVSRLRLFFLRYAAGLACFCAAMVALFAASYLAAASVPRPVGIYAYPGHYAVWIALWGWVLFTFGFVIAIRASRPAATLIVLLTVIATGLAASSQRRNPIQDGARWFGPSSPMRLMITSPRLFDY